MSELPDYLQEQIQAVREGRSETLDLSSPSFFGRETLAAIPEEVIGLTVLEELDLAGNNVSAGWRGRAPRITSDLGGLQQP